MFALPGATPSRVPILKPCFEMRSSFPRTRDSMFTGPKWIPVFAGMTSFGIATILVCLDQRAPAVTEHLPGRGCRVIGQ
jgi:hypothetical protein